MRVAGLGHRSYAFVVDWHIRVLAALGWITILVLALRLDWNANAAAAWPAIAPAAMIYFLYHPLIEILMRGQSPGKRVAGVRIVMRGGGTPGVGAILIRNAMRLIDCLPALYMTGLISCFVTRDQVRLGDLAAGTLLVLDEQRAPSAADRTA